jgi:hypothetical protein
MPFGAEACLLLPLWWVLDVVGCAVVTFVVGLVEVVGATLDVVDGAGASVPGVVGPVSVCSKTDGGAWSVVTGAADVVVTISVGSTDTEVDTLGGSGVVDEGGSDVTVGAGSVVLSTCGSTAVSVCCCALTPHTRAPASNPRPSAPSAH